ncbi:hypothetical protein RDV63_12105 [Rheinheimera sp. MMS21-TC3]|nr:hypothetical protein [Rheinheimera sp. MMS21-TC3]WNO61663.1 hypothetical protein RDV63_12105 [Rheinheimera sp. MMS21-TC3]
MALSLSIVLPLTVKQVESAKHRSERQLSALFIEQMQNSSFFLSRPVKISVNGKSIKAKSKQFEQELTLQYTSFAEKTLSVSPDGIVDPISLEAYINGQAWQLVIDDEKALWSYPD